VEGRRRAVDAVLGVIALAPPLPGQAGAVKTQLMINRIAQRLALKEETVWARLNELRQQRQRRDPRPSNPARAEARVEGPAGTSPAAREQASQQAPAAPEERELLQVLLADPGLVPAAAAAVRPEEIEHPGLRRLLEGLYALHAEGEAPTLDLLRARLDSPHLQEKALQMQDVGRANPDRPAWLGQLLARFQERRARPVKQDLRNQLRAATASRDAAAALELLRRLQDRTSELGPDTSSSGERGGGWGDSAPTLPPA
jgi:DNA primase